jgi:hypothetical protein
MLKMALEKRNQEKKSTFTAIQSFTEDVQKALDNKLLALGIFFGSFKGI